MIYRAAFGARRRRRKLPGGRDILIDSLRDEGVTGRTFDATMLVAAITFIYDMAS